MTGAHLHLLLNHFPIIGLLIGVGVLAYGLFKKNNLINTIGLSIIMLMAIIAVPAYLTGEEAEEAVEHIKGVTDEAIHEHEELAEKAILLMSVLGILALTSLYAIKKELAFAKKVTLITFIVSILTFGLFAKVGNLGGEIRHTELQNNTSINIDHDEDVD